MPQKRLNRKKIIKQLEQTRQSLDSAIGLLLRYKDVVMASSLKVSYSRVNDLIVELGGESYPETFLDYYQTEKFKLNASEKNS